MPINAVRMSQPANRERTQKEWGPIHCDRPHSKFRLARLRKTIEALPAGVQIQGKSGISAAGEDRTHLIVV
jgi:hypothetical protein